MPRERADAVARSAKAKGLSAAAVGRTLVERSHVSSVSVKALYRGWETTPFFVAGALLSF
jgi:hypothetical protein